jgi:hypothetical protein
MRDVLIIESPSYDDLYSGDSRGDVINRQLGLLRVPARLKNVATMKHFAERYVLEAAALQFDALHLAMHGDRTGLFMTDGGHLPWKDLHFLSVMLSGRMLVLDACESAAFMPDTSIADFLNNLIPGLGATPPRFVLTMMGKPYFADSVLAWGVFYAHLAGEAVGVHSTSMSPRVVFDALQRVKAAGLPKICASYSNGGRYASISPWNATRPDP